MDELHIGTPEEAGVRPEAVGNIHQRAQQWVTKGRTPALVLLAARKGVIFLHEAYGRLTPEDNAPKLPKDALFPLASLSKPITATALMLLVEDGKVGLNRPVQEYIPEFRGEGKEAVMLHHLLTHTSGLRSEEWQKEIEAGAKPSEIPAPDKTMHPKVNELLFLLYRAPLAQGPGREMEYSDANYYLVGEIVRRVSGQSLEQYVRERIFDPLAMDDSYYVVPGDAQKRVVRRPEDAPGYAYENPEFMERPSPSAGAYSTASDMAKFGQMFLNRGRYGRSRILSRAAVAAMTRDQIPGISADFLHLHFPDAGWGYGWSIAYPFKSRVYGEDLLTPGYFNHGGSGGVEMWVDPGNEVVGVYFSVALDLDHTDYPIHDADLFMNMVTAGIRTEDPGHASAEAIRNAVLKPAESGPKSGSMAAAAIHSSIPSHAVELRAGTFEEAGIDPERVNKVRELAKGWVDSDMHPAISIVAARHGVVFLNEAFGRIGPEKNAAPLTQDAIFPLASLTKPITATAVMMLVEDGVVSLNRPVQDYIPEFQGEGKELITIRHLLTHTSGLSGEDLVELAETSGILSDSEQSEANWVKLFKSFDEYLDLIFRVQPSFPPGRRMSYCVCNHDLLGEIIERVSGTKYPQFVSQRILEPLGMKNTFIPVPKNVRKMVVRRSETAPFYYFLSTLLESGIPSGGSGFFGTAMDQAIFGQMFLNGGTYGDARILSQASVAAMTRDEIPGIEAFEGDTSIGAAEWGLGWSIHETNKSLAYDEPLLSPGSYTHGGAGGVSIWIDPAQDLVAVFFTTYLSETKAGQPVAATDLFINSLLASVVD